MKKYSSQLLKDLDLNVDEYDENEDIDEIDDDEAELPDPKTE